MNKRLYKFNDRHNNFKDAASIFERQISLYSLPQLYEELSNGQPLFSAVININDTYETLESSNQKIHQFLTHHFDVEKETFVHFLYDLLNKNSGKKNCLNIIGPPSSGKTYFARIIKEALIVSGMIANMNNRCGFPLNNCINKRVLHWDEPSFDPGAIETIKCIFSGDELSTPVKYSDNGSLMRTPIISTANTYVWPKDDAFDCRIETFRFKSFNTLKEWRQLNPMCLYQLFIDYNLLKD